VIGGVLVFGILRKNPKLLGGVEFLEATVKKIKEKIGA
jgi:hypothetical protein